MTLNPTFNELYNEVADVLAGDAEHQLDDFSAGSWPDAIAALGAATAQAAVRRARRIFGRFLRTTAQGSDLDALVVNLFGPAPELARRPGELDEAYNARIDAYLQAGLLRGTTAALRWLVTQGGLVAVATGTVAEDFATGIITITVTPSTGYTGAQAVAAVAAVIDAWRPASHACNIAEAV